MLLDPRHEIGDIGEARRWLVAVRGVENEAVNAVLEPPVALFADQRTARVAAAEALVGHHWPGTHRVLFHAYAALVGLGNDRHVDLLEDIAVSPTYTYVHVRHLTS